MFADTYRKILSFIKQQLETISISTEPKLIPIKVRSNKPRHRPFR